MTWSLCIVYKTSLRLLLFPVIHSPTSANETFCKHNQTWSFCFKCSIASPRTGTNIQTPKTLQETKQALKKCQQNISTWKDLSIFFKQVFDLQWLKCEEKKNSLSRLNQVPEESSRSLWIYLHIQTSVL